MWTFSFENLLWSRTFVLDQLSGTAWDIKVTLTVGHVSPRLVHIFISFMFAGSQEVQQFNQKKCRAYSAQREKDLVFRPKNTEYFEENLNNIVGYAPPPRR